MPISVAKWVVGILFFIFFAPPTSAGEDAASLYREGLRLFSEGHTEAAVAALQRSVSLQPKNAAAWKALGVVFASTGDFEHAEGAFGNACDRQRTLPDACLYRGRTLYLLDRFPAAVDALRRALALQDSPEGHRLLALSLEAMGRAPEAETEFRTAVRTGHNAAADEDPGIDYGVFLYRQGRMDEAMDALRAAVARHADSPRARLELGCTLLAMNRLDDAARELERSLALRPTPRTHLLLGKTYQRLGKAEAAEAQLQLAR